MQNKNMAFMVYNITMLCQDTKYNIITVLKTQSYEFFKTSVR